MSMIEMIIHLAAAKKPRDIIISHPLMLRLQTGTSLKNFPNKEELRIGKEKHLPRNDYQIERASIATSAFFMFPVKRTSTVLYQSSRL
jgi:hypothetical protein